jgi:hypothetical protein
MTVRERAGCHRSCQQRPAANPAANEEEIIERAPICGHAG